MAVNTTNLTGAGSLYQYTQVVDDATNGLFFGLILISFFVVLIMNMRNQGIDRAIAGASFSCLIISIILWNIGLLQVLYPVAFALLLAGTLVYLHFRPTG